MLAKACAAALSIPMVWGQPPAYIREAIELSEVVLRLGSNSPRKSPDKETDLSDAPISASVSVCIFMRAPRDWRAIT